jgi:thiamine-phosphate pyrophosphorylase
MIYAITNRKLVSGGEAAYFRQIERIAAAGPDGIILREKDMTPEAYTAYALRCREICERWGIPLILNHFWEAAEKTGVRRIHLSMPVFRELVETGAASEIFKTMAQVGVSVHSCDEAVYARDAGAEYLIAGHIFLTDCKKGLPARGLDFLKDICQSVDIPVFAIGGMNEVHGAMAIEAGADGVCMMSELMRSDKPEEIIKRFSGRLQ